MTARPLIATLLVALFCGNANAGETVPGEAAGPSGSALDDLQPDSTDGDQRILDRFRGTRRTTLRIVKRGEQTPIFTLSADVGEIDDTNTLTVTLDNEAPPPRGSVWLATEDLRPSRTSEGPALPQMAAVDDPDRAFRSPPSHLSRLPSNWAPVAWSDDGVLRVETDGAGGLPGVPVSSPRISSLSALDKLPAEVPAVPDSPTLALWAAGLAAIALVLNRRRQPAGHRR
jgi:hypothetical protein